MNRSITISLRLLLTVVVLSTAATGMWASQVRPVDVDEMTARATRIFDGRCIKVEKHDHGAALGVVSVYTFRVEHAVKGVSGATEVVRIADPEGDGSVSTFEVGDRAVLFLYGENAKGLTSPVGLGQGHFEVYEDKNGRTLATNRRLGRGPHGTRGAEMELDTLLDRARSPAR